MKYTIHVIYLLIILGLFYYFTDGFKAININIETSLGNPDTLVEYQNKGEEGGTDMQVNPKVQENSGNEATQQEPETPVVEKVTTGTVEASLCYPSEGIPPLENYLKNTATNATVLLNSTQNEQQITFNNVPAGKYIAYSFIPNEYNYAGGYTEFVPCGLSVNCSDHSYIEFEVKAGQTTTGVDICDWYGAPLP